MGTTGELPGTLTGLFFFFSGGLTPDEPTPSPFELYTFFQAPVSWTVVQYLTRGLTFVFERIKRDTIALTHQI